jgi:hypothetical protein
MEQGIKIKEELIARVILKSTIVIGNNWTNERLLRLIEEEDEDIIIRPLNYEEWELTDAIKLVHTPDVIFFENDLGELHRVDGPAFISRKLRAWYREGLWHREDGPALIFSDGSCVYYRHGLRHRVDGPAVDMASGHQEWWIDGELVSSPPE